MDLARELFDLHYATALKHRDAFADRESLASWFPGRVAHFPPIICFGFPCDPKEKIPLATLGINPSPREITNKHVSSDEDPATQFLQQSRYFERGRLDWFDRAQLIIQTLSEDLPEDQRATYGGVLGGRRNTIHLDLSPVVTAPIERTERDVDEMIRNLVEARNHADRNGDFARLADYQTDLDLASEQRSAPKELDDLLGRGTREILEPLLTSLIDRHGTQLVVALGGAKWLKAVGLSPDVCAEKWPKAHWAFLGSGPSASCSNATLVARTRQYTTAKQLVSKALSTPPAS